MIKKLTYEEVYNRFKEKGYKLLDKEYVSSSTRMTCIDKDGYKYFVCNNLLQNGRIPEKFNKYNPYTLENVENLLKLESNGSKLLTKEYVDSRMKLTITCECCGKEVTKSWNSIVNDKNFKCYECCNYSSNVRKYSFDFIKKEFKKFGYKILDDEYLGNNNKLNCIDKNGYYVKCKYTNLITNSNPYIFSIKFNKENYIKNINRYFELNNIKCKALYYLDDEYIASNNVVVCKCECGNIFNTTWNSIKDGQYRCKKCTSYISKNEYKVKKWLDDNNIKYISQKKFKDCKDIRCLPFDFYLPKYNCCIEVDGQQHFYPSKFSKNSDKNKNFKKIKKHDEIKTLYCKNNNIDLLRISFNDIRRKNKNYINILSNKFIKE